jgi:hypothetical protein
MIACRLMKLSPSPDMKEAVNSGGPCIKPVCTQARARKRPSTSGPFPHAMSQIQGNLTEQRDGALRMGAVGSTFGLGGGGFVLAIIYLILGPAAIVYHLSRLAFNAYSSRTRSRATLRPSEFDTIKRCLPWNVAISLLPAIPSIVNAVFG